MEKYLVNKWGLNDQVDEHNSSNIKFCGKLGKPGKDKDGNPTRVYEKKECDSLGGQFDSAGNCKKPDGSTFNNDCVGLNFPLQLAVTGCEGEAADIACPDGSVIVDGKFLFGKWDKTNCGAIPYKPKNHPSYNKSISIIEDIVGKQNAKVTVNTDLFKGDPEPQVKKQFEIQFMCGAVKPDAVISRPAKFVKISGGADYLHVAQIVVLNKKGENVAKGRKVTSSGQHGGGNDGKPENAVDGVQTVKNWPNIYHSNGGNAFLMVELDDTESFQDGGAADKGINLSSVVVYQRGDCCKERLATGYKVEIVDKDSNVMSSLPLTMKDKQSFTYIAKSDSDEMIKKLAQDKVASDKAVLDAKARSISLAVAQEEAIVLADRRAKAYALAEAEELVRQEQARAYAQAEELARANIRRRKKNS